MSMKVYLNDQGFDAEPEQTILDVAQRHGVEIPHLCHHEALSGRACCRLCLVEVGDLPGQRNVVVACTYPAEEDLQVYTATEQIVELRRLILALLREQAPAAEGELLRYCEEYGVTGFGQRFSVDPTERCILCGLCTRACQLLGNSAIAAARRGVDKVVSTAFGEPSEDCIGCAACARVCPTQAIDCIEADGQRTIWQKDFELVRCTACGKPYATAEELAWLKAKLVAAEMNLQYCPSCRGKASIPG